MSNTPHLDKVVALAGRTRDYTRVEHGREEHVSGYSEVLRHIESASEFHPYHWQSSGQAQARAAEAKAAEHPELGKAVQHLRDAQAAPWDEAQYHLAQAHEEVRRWMRPAPQKPPPVKFRDV